MQTSSDEVKLPVRQGKGLNAWQNKKRKRQTDHINKMRGWVPDVAEKRGREGAERGREEQKRRPDEGTAVVAK